MRPLQRAKAGLELLMGVVGMMQQDVGEEVAPAQLANPGLRPAAVASYSALLTLAR